MKKISNKKIFLIILIVLIISQFIKILVTNNLLINKEYSIINNFFSLFYTINTGAAFSILESNQMFIIITDSLLIVLLLYYIYKNKFTKLETISLSFIIGGTISNIIDRITNGGVVDYLYFKIVNYNFPIFNTADISIVIGVIILILTLLKKDIEVKSKK